MNRRPLVAGALAVVAVTATGLLSACGAGQIAQTAAVRPGVPGINTQAPDGRLVFVRNAALGYPGPDGYRKGGNAPLAVWIFNDTETPVTLVGVFGPTVVESEGSNDAAPCAVPRSIAPSAPSSVTAPTGTATASPTGTSGASPSADKSAKSSAPAKGSPSPSGSSASPSPAPSPTFGSATIDVKIPAGGCVELSRRAANYLQIVGLPKDVPNADAVPVIFAFTGGDGKNFTIGTPDQPVLLPVATPDSPQPRKS